MAAEAVGSENVLAKSLEIQRKRAQMPSSRSFMRTYV